MWLLVSRITVPVGAVVWSCEILEVGVIVFAHSVPESREHQWPIFSQATVIWGIPAPQGQGPHIDAVVGWATLAQA